MPKTPEYQPTEGEIKKAKDIMEAEGLEERSKEAQDAFKAGKKVERNIII